LRAVIELLRAEYGLDPTRGGMVRALAAHVEARCEKLGIDVASYIERLHAQDGDERRRLIHAATVRHSWFYRDPGQLEQLTEVLQARHAQAPERPLDLWVAGCAGGEEAWTVAMLATDLGLPARVLATDVDSAVLHDAQAACYSAWSLRELPRRLWRFFEPAGQNRWCVRQDQLSVSVEFAVHNLCDPPPERNFDLISCRNVLIYFEPGRAHAVVRKIERKLRPGGELVLGAGDLLFRLDDGPRPRLGMTRARARHAPKSVEVRPRPEPKVRAFERLEVRAAPVRAPSGPVAGTAEPTLGGGEADASRSAAVETVEVVEAVEQAREKLCRAARTVEAGEYEPALEQLAALVAGDPLLAEAHLWAGIAHYGLGQSQLAAEALRRARCLVPQLWPATLFAALTNERRGRWTAARQCWIELERTIQSEDRPAIEGTSVLVESLPRWRAEALALARQRISKHARVGGSHD
jgi:chemotaxis protein methyltransferase CheR